jgi:peptidoglycan/xylan/chitin deacetylase (PgdA/CDA1 family)
MAWSEILAAAPVTAGGVLAWGAYHPASSLFGRTLRHAPSGQTIALTFDDGPNPAVTPHLLDILDRHGARVTFFVIGRWVRAYPAIVREAVARGHAIGNHTETHPNLIFAPKRRIVAELVQCQEAIEEAAGVRPSLMRPPWGARGPQLQAALGESGLSQVVMWSLLARDWYPRGKRRLRTRLERAIGGDIVVFHDGFHGMLGADRQDTLRALKYWLPRWTDAGLTCVPLT